MSRKEVINLIMELSQYYNFTMAKSHLDYLIKKEKIKGLNHNGCTIKAQAMTTKCSQTHKEQQLQWHTALEEAFAEQQHLNQPAEEFKQLQDDFFGNIDKTCLMANQHGEVCVIALAEKKKMEKIVDDSHCSITSL